MNSADVSRPLAPRRLTLNLDSRSHRILLQGCFGVLLIGVWQLLHIAMPTAIPSLIQVFVALETQITEGTLVRATIDALVAIFLGYALAVIVGVTIGLVMGINRSLERFFNPYVDALYVLPFSAIVPAMIIWFGTGLSIRVAVVTLFAVFPILINTLGGVKTTPPGLVAAARSFGAGRLFILRQVVLPHEVSYLMAGLRLGMGRAVKGLVIAELLVAVSGFGGIITEWSAAFKMGGVFAAVGVLMVIGVVLTGLLRRIEQRVVRWSN